MAGAQGQILGGTIWGEGGERADERDLCCTCGLGEAAGRCSGGTAAAAAGGRSRTWP